MPKQKLLLKTDVVHLGRSGEVVEVADGHARNYLLPQKLAVQATPGVLARLKESEARRAKGAEGRLEEARVLAGKLAEVTVTIQAAAGPDGKLYGSITGREVAKALADEGIKLPSNALSLAEPLKEIGTHTVPVRLHADVQATVKVWIVEK